MWLSRGFAQLILRRIDNFEERVGKLEQLEKKLADLEEQIQSQPKKVVDSIAQEMSEMSERLEKNIQNYHY